MADARMSLYLTGRQLRPRVRIYRPAPAGPRTRKERGARQRRALCGPHPHTSV